MSISKTKQGTWQVDLRCSDGSRIRKRFKSRIEAARFEHHTIGLQQQGKAWLVPHQDLRKLSDIVQLWYDLHGVNLRDGARRFAKLVYLVSALRDPVATRLTAASFAAYRVRRQAEGTSGKTLNNELGYLRAVFNELYALGELDYKNPLEKVKPLRLQDRSLSFLTPVQVQELLTAIQTGCDNPHVYPITLICLATGCRWSEAESLKPKNLHAGQVVFEGTKSGKVRAVPVSGDLVKLIRAHWKKLGTFTGSLSSFRRALHRCSFKLPAGQASHVLRHTFASHFVQGGGNMLVLQKILGHSSLAMTMRYAHLAPNHLQEALALNPVGQILGKLEKSAGTKKPQPLNNQTVTASVVGGAGGI
ncbi:MAG: tyrosine-type recombinase/integrase [Gammaproteobacteria bacterium]|nr:tyrosine-type recombinase/integrase [Gammaproteobacteria bacterium]